MSGNAIQPAMIPAAGETQGAEDWHAEMRAAYRDPAVLLRDLGLDPGFSGLEPKPAFPFLVTRAFAGRMRRGDPEDPLLRQVLPLAAERHATAGFVADPVGDQASRSSGGLLQKYHGRALLITTGACPIHCRYCFRREFDYAANQLSRPRLEAALARIAESPDVGEVILSGGDPLMLSDRRLAELADGIGSIGHVRRLRIHSRVPVTLPSRITDNLLEALGRAGLPMVFVVHANHANEFDASVGHAIERLRARARAVFNQAVLLAGVNNDVGALQRLMETGFEHGVVPYYLHLLDRVAGSAHHEVGADRARALIDELRTRLPGFLVPRLVRERAGAPYKLPVT